MIHGQGRRATEGGFYITGEGPVSYLLCSLFGRKCSGDQLRTQVLPTLYSECAEGITALVVGKMSMLSTISPFSMVCSRQKLVEYPTTIFGDIYIQCNMEGLASYHCEEEESYISYSAATPYWRPDDGAPPPVRPFLNSSHYMDTRTFRGYN